MDRIALTKALIDALTKALMDDDAPADVAEGRPAMPNHVGDKCIIRCYASGVHFGTVTAHEGRTVALADARRLWRWDVAPHGISLSEVARFGPVGDRSRICAPVPKITLLDALEIIPCTAPAIKVIENATVAKP